MKKLNSILLFLLISGSNAFAQVGATKIAVFDSIKMMEESKEWEAFKKETQVEVEAARAEFQVAQKEIAELRKEIQEKSSAGLLKMEALQQENQKLAQKQKDMERKLGDKDEALKTKVKTKQMAVARKHMEVIKESILDKGICDLILEKNNVLASDKIDLTDRIIKSINEKYEKEVAEKITGKELKAA